MKRMAVIYFSRTGNTAAMAETIADGAREEKDIHVEVVKVEDFNVDEMPSYDAFVIGSPTYYGSMAYQVKKLFDDSVKFHGKLSGKVGGAFSSAANIGGGNETTVEDILNAMLIHGMVVQGSSSGDHYGPVSIGAPDERVVEQCRSLGRRTAALAKKIT